MGMCAAFVGGEPGACAKSQANVMDRAMGWVRSKSECNIAVFRGDIKLDPRKDKLLAARVIARVEIVLGLCCWWHVASLTVAGRHIRPESRRSARRVPKTASVTSILGRLHGR